MNKNVYFPTYTIDPESIYGSGIVNTNKFPYTDTTTSVITDSFPINKKLSPPVYRSGVSQEPLDTNGYRVLKNQNKESRKLDNYYYPTQQSNRNTVPDIRPTFKQKLKKKIKDVANKFINEEDNLEEDTPQISSRRIFGTIRECFKTLERQKPPRHKGHKVSQRLEISCISWCLCAFVVTFKTYS